MFLFLDGEKSLVGIIQLSVAYLGFSLIVRKDPEYNSAVNCIPRLLMGVNWALVWVGVETIL